MIPKTPEEKAAIKAAKKAYKQNNQRGYSYEKERSLDQRPKPMPILTGLMEGENVLPDDYIVNWDYLYVAEQKDGSHKVIRSDIKGTIEDLKVDIRRRTGFWPPSIYNCKQIARNIF